MQRNYSWPGRVIPQAAIVVMLVWTAIASAQPSEKVLHNFGGPGDGYEPTSGVVWGSQGNLYGTTYYGGSGCLLGCGVVFQLKPQADGGWFEGVIHKFDQTDGGQPNGIVLNREGAMFGSTQSWGTGGFGTVYELTLGFNGVWNESVLHTFEGLWDGGTPGGIAFDSAGHLYGTTGYLDVTHDGNVFSLNPVSAIDWFELVLHVFKGGSDNYTPSGKLAFDPEGNIYGTSFYGGPNDTGSVFKLSRNHGGQGWTETILYVFKGAAFQAGQDGVNPYAGVVIDAAGNLYGTTEWGGSAGAGTVFELTPRPDGTWFEQVIYAFQGGLDGGHPRAGLVMDSAGNLYGTTTGGKETRGTVFELIPTGPRWKETVLHEFQGGLDGDTPQGDLVLDGKGNLYGTTVHGGTYGEAGGVVFEITQ